jgi:hypothetical protein
LFRTSPLHLKYSQKKGDTFMAILLYKQVAELTEEQLDFLIEHLEEEWSEDRDYYINKDMVAMLEQRGADTGLIRILQDALGDKDEVEVLWVDTEEDYDEEEEEDE